MKKKVRDWLSHLSLTSCSISQRSQTTNWVCNWWGGQKFKTMSKQDFFFLSVHQKRKRIQVDFMTSWSETAIDGDGKLL